MLHIFGKLYETNHRFNTVFEMVIYYFFLIQLLLTCYSLFLLLNVIKFEETILKKLTKCNVHIVVSPIIVSVLKIIIIMCPCMYYSKLKNEFFYPYNGCFALFFNFFFIRMTSPHPPHIITFVLAILCHILIILRS